MVNSEFLFLGIKRNLSSTKGSVCCAYKKRRGGGCQLCCYL